MTGENGSSLHGFSNNDFKTLDINDYQKILDIWKQNDLVYFLRGPNKSSVKKMTNKDQLMDSYLYQLKTNKNGQINIKLISQFEGQYTTKNCCQYLNNQKALFFVQNPLLSKDEYLKDKRKLQKIFKKMSLHIVYWNADCVNSKWYVYI